MIEVGTRVMYASGQYEVVERQADLLVLRGRAVIYRTPGGQRYGWCRASITVLATDVTVVGEQGVGSVTSQQQRAASGGGREAW